MDEYEHAPVDPATYRDVLDLIRYMTTENWAATMEILRSYHGDLERSQGLYSGMAAINAKLAQLLATERGSSVESILDELRRYFPGES